MSCSRVIIGRIVDGISINTIIDVLSDNIFDYTTSSSSSHNNNDNDENDTGKTLLRNTWKRVRLETSGPDDYYLSSSSSSSSSSIIGQWKVLNNNNNPQQQQIPLIEFYQIHAVKNTNECIATVVVVILSSSTTNCSSSPAMFQMACNSALMNNDNDDSDSDEEENDKNGSESKEETNNNTNNLQVSNFLEPSIKNKINSSRQELVEDISEFSQREHLILNISAALATFFDLTSSDNNNNDNNLNFISSSSKKEKSNQGQEEENNKDPWLHILGGSSSQKQSSNPSFNSLSKSECEKIEGCLKPMISQRLGFGTGTSWISRPLGFPLLQGREIDQSSSVDQSNSNTSSQQQQQPVYYPAIVLVDIINREVTESGVVVRDCTEVYCDIPRIGRLPPVVAKSTSKNATTFGRRFGIVAMDWSYLNSSDNKNENNNELDVNENNNSSSVTKTNQHQQLQKFSFDWSTLRKPFNEHLMTAEEQEVSASYSLPWSSSPPRTIGATLMRQEILSEFSNVYEAALTRSQDVCYSLHPSQVAATNIRGLRTLMCDISPSTLRNSGMSLASSVLINSGDEISSSVSSSNNNTDNSTSTSTSAAFSKSHSLDQKQHLVDISRVSARLVAKRYAATNGSQNKKFAESQITSMKRLFGPAAIESASSAGAGGFFTSAAANAAKHVIHTPDQISEQDLPPYKRIARIISQQPRCFMSGHQVEDNGVGVRCRLSIAPQVLSRPVVNQYGRKLQLECSLRCSVAFTSAENSFNLNKTMFDSLQAFQMSDFASSGAKNGNELQTVYCNNAIRGGSFSSLQQAVGASNNNSFGSTNRNTTQTISVDGHERKLVLDTFQLVISGSSYAHYTSPSQSPIAREPEACRFHSVELKSSLSGATISTSEKQKQKQQSSHSSPNNDSSHQGSSFITWTFPTGTTVNLNEDITLTGKIFLETCWPDEKTATAIVDAIKFQAAKPFPMPPINAQIVEMLGFLDGDFNSGADDASISASHVDAFSATCVQHCVPNEQSSNQNSNNSQQQNNNNKGCWRSFSEGLRSTIQSASQPSNNNNNNNFNSTCLLCATKSDISVEENNNNITNNNKKENEQQKEKMTTTATTTQVETLIPDWSSGFSSDHLSASVGCQLASLSQSTFQAAPSSVGTDYSSVVVPMPKARIIACGEKFGSSYVVWNRQ